MTDRDKTLEELDGENWGEPNYNSYLVKSVHRLRCVPLKKLTVEDLRLMIGQEVNLNYLMPLAIERLEINPYAEGDFYPGDLLYNVLSINRNFWKHHPNLRRQVNLIIDRAAQISNDNEELTDEIKDFLKEKLETFEQDEAR
jgi:hypothetical protein